MTSSVLIIGGTGFLGVNLALRLCERGHHVSLVGSRKVPDFMSSADRNLKIYQDRLLHRSQIDDLLTEVKPSIVLHMASSMNPGSSLIEYYRERRDIMTPAIQLIQALVKMQLPIVFFSSGGAIYGPSRKSKLSETDSCNPISFYGLSKLELETQIHFASRAFGLRYLIIRPSNPYGPFQSLHGNQGLISVILGKILRNEPLEVWGDGSSIRDYIHVDDLTSSVCEIIDKDAWNLTVNVGSGVGHSLLDVVRAAERATGKTVEIAFTSARGSDVDRVVLDVSRLAAIGSWYTRPLELGIESYATHAGVNLGR